MPNQNLNFGSVVSEFITAALAGMGVDYIGTHNVSYEPDGNPPSRAGQIHVTHDFRGSFNVDGNAEDQSTTLTERLRWSVWISFNHGALPTDYKGDYNYSADQNLELVARNAIRLIHGQWYLVGYINDRLEALTDMEWPVVLPLRLISQSRNEPKPGDWGNGQLDDNNAAGWLVRRLDFEGFDRVISNYDLE